MTVRNRKRTIRRRIIHKKSTKRKSRRRRNTRRKNTRRRTTKKDTHTQKKSKDVFIEKKGDKKDLRIFVINLKRNKDRWKKYDKYNKA